MNKEELYEILLSDDVIDRIKENEEDVFSLVPGLKVCKGFDQNNPWHIYDVYEHILHVIDYCPKELYPRLAALFHDVGKPLCYTEDENGVGHFRNHWKYSLRMFLEFANQNYVNANTVSLVSKLIYYHDLRFKEDDINRIKILLDSFDEEELKILYDLKRADLLAQNEEYHYLLNDLDKQEEMMLTRYKGTK